MKNLFPLSSISLAGLSLGFSPLLAAQTTPVLPPIIVTADRVATTVDQTLASVSVITRDDIEREQINTVSDALRGLPGISVVNNGGQGKMTSLFIRGTNYDHVLVLIDGVKVGSATTGTAALENIPVDQIERIELVRGPRASLYGSEAIGGVIQIFTRKDTKKGFTPSFSLGTGSLGTYSAAMNLASSNVEAGKGVWFNLGLTGDKTNGFNACESNLYAGCYTDEPDRDGYKNASVSLRGGYKYSPRLSVEAQLLQTYFHNYFDGPYQNNTIGREQVLSAALRYKPLNNWQSSLILGRNIDDTTSYLDKTFSSIFKTTRTTFSWQNDLTVGDEHTFTVGIDGLNDKVSSTTAFDKTSRNNLALFGQYLGDFDKNDVQFNFREDHNEQFGYFGTGSAALGHTFSKKFRVSASYGTAFKAPSFNQLYYPDYGSSTLQPEKSQSVEIAFSGKHSLDGKWQVSLYQTDIDNLIANGGNWLPQNINQAQIRGVEGSFDWKLAGINFSAFVTLLDPINRSGDANDGKQLQRRARQSVRLDADRKFGAWRLGGSLIAQGKSYEDEENTIKLGGFGTVDLRAEYRFNKAWRLQTRIENLLDKNYQTAYLYHQAGFGIFATLRYSPQ